MTAQVTRHHHHYQSRHAPAHAHDKAANMRRHQLQRSNDDAQASSQTSLSASSHSRMGMQASGRAFASNKAMAAQTMNARSTASSMGLHSLGSAPSMDLASTVNPALAGHRQRQSGGTSRSAPTSGNPIIAGYRQKVAQSFGFKIVNGARRPLTTPQEIMEQYTMLEEERQRLPVTNMGQLHTRDILIARRQYLLVQLARNAQISSAGGSASRPMQSGGRHTTRPDTRSTSSSSASMQSLSDPVPDSSWSDYCKSIEAVFLKTVKNHGKVHKGCTYDGEFPCEEWLGIARDCGGQPSHDVYEEHAQEHPDCSLGGSHSCAAWLQLAQEVRVVLQRQVETLFVAEQDIQRARACIFAICKNAMMLPFIRDYNRKMKGKRYLCRDGKQRSITLDREEMNGWREEIENTIALAYKHGKSIDAALRGLRDRTVWKQLGEPERQYLKRYFKLDPRRCQVYEEPSEYLAPSGSTHASSFASQSQKSYAWTEMGVPEDQRSAVRGELEAIQKERKKRFKMKNWISEANANVPKVQEAMKTTKQQKMPTAIAQTLQHMQAWEKHRQDVVPPMSSRDDAPSSRSSSSSSSATSSSRKSGSISGSGSASGASRSSGAKRSDRGRYDALDSVVLDESNSRPGGKPIPRAPLVHEEDDEDEDEGESADEYDDYDGDETEALMEELRQSGQRHSSGRDGDRQPTMTQGYDDGYGSVSSATDVSSGDTNSAYQETAPRHPTGRRRKH